MYSDRSSFQSEHETRDVRCRVLLNVLDRCDRPRTLFAENPRTAQTTRAFITRCCLTILSICRIWSEKITTNRTFAFRGGLCPCSQPPIASRRYPTFETCVSHMIEDVIVPAGYDVESVSRVPYLSKGGRFGSPTMFGKRIAIRFSS